MLTNAYKHAFTDRENGNIIVSLIDNSTNCKLVIADDGIGLPKEIKVTETPSMGMELIHILAEQLDANLKIERDRGTQFILELKPDLKIL